ncbi:ABC transporter substrate-binding protein [Microbacterium rhizosphaerae]|uniref:ABC transporter substrate-binding protein n=1 Tax=Microbacterium rhizosphaerae TaxID=1678237 RepID=A0ABZ0SIG7_9MICO|nr:ABC transporter substrate-binding protein [Microbacterium rhizosphaerae]WPR89129.1 ABC transporter substrate-binding protein [Microbacterium rhizosphaerae]
MKGLRKVLTVAAVAAVSAIALSACAGTSTPAKTSGSPLVVWTDATREAAFKAYQTAHPDVKMKIEVVDGSGMLSKIQLANRVGSGWPDVIFDPTTNEIAALQSQLFNFAAPLDKAVPKNVQDGFSTKNSICKIDGKLYCLQNDLAQSILWVNKPLMAQFGYQVPTTWDEYKALGQKVAAEHPGYIIGAAGGANIWYDFLWSSGCPLADVKSSNQVHINTADAKCTRVADTLDPLLADGSVSRLAPFDAGMNKLAKDGKVLMMPGPSWMGEYVIKASTGYGAPAGTIVAGAMPTWTGETTNWSGAYGGGIYVVSRHAADPAAAAAVAQWVSTNDAYQKTAPTYPAYAPAATTWSQTVTASGYYAEDPVPVLKDQAAKINPAVGATRYQVDATVVSTVVASIKAGGDIASTLKPLQDQLSGLAQAAGYEVVTK